jgi:uncharacterized membrane protein
MRKARIACVILFILALNCFIWPTNALNLNYYGIESRIQDDLTVSNIITLTFEPKIQDFEYSLKYNILKLKVESDNSPVECETKAADTTIISCKFLTPRPSEETNVKISFETTDIIKNSNDYFEFSNFVSMDADTKRFFNIIYLPQAASLTTEVSNESFSPRNGKTLSDGRHIMVYWDRENVETGEDLYFSVTYRTVSNNMVSIYGVGAMVLIAVIIIASLGMYYVRSVRRQDSVKVVMPLLKHDEKTVVDILRKNDDSVNQKVIVRESDFSKAKVSRIIADLKEREVVDVESMGRTNKITLKIKKWTKEDNKKQ